MVAGLNGLVFKKNYNQIKIEICFKFRLKIKKIPDDRCRCAAGGVVAYDRGSLL